MCSEKCLGVSFCPKFIERVYLGDVDHTALCKERPINTRRMRLLLVEYCILVYFVLAEFPHVAHSDQELNLLM